MARFNALRGALEDDTVSDEALDFVADPYADPTTRLLRSGRASPEVEAFLARQNEIQDRRDAERAVKTASRLPPVKAQEDVAQEGVPAYLRPSNWVTARSSPLGLSQSKLSGEQVGSRGVVPVPPPVGIRLPVEAGPMMTAPSAPSAPAVSRGTAPAVKTPEAQPIPVANASTRTDAPTAVSSALPSTGPRTPAGTPNSADKYGMVAPSSEGAGGDTSERDLYLARLAAQNAAGFGGMGAGKNIDMGIADTLGERLKQVQALRAKREEQSLEQQRERATWGTSNRAALASALAQWKGDPERTAALEALAPGVDTTKQSDFAKGLYNAVMTKPKVLGAEAGVAKTEAGTDAAKAKEKTEDLLREPKARKLGTAADLDEARIKAIRAKTAADALALTKSRASVAAAGKAGTPSKDAIKYIRDDLKTAEKSITPTLENLKAIEAVSPGFAFGRPEKELETLEFVAAAKLPRFAQQASDLRSAVEALIIDIRHGSFGASLTASEKESFESMLNTGLSGTVGQLSKAIDRVRRKAAATAQTHFNTSQQFYPTETQQVLSTSAVFGPAISEGGIYSDVWTLPKAKAATKRKPQPTNTTAMLDENGKPQYVPNDQVSAAEAAGWKRE